MHEHEQEREYIARLQQGDIVGLEGLVGLHQLRAVRTAYLITRDLPQAQDIVQAAFLRAYERIDQLDQRRPFGPWFYTSCCATRSKSQTNALDTCHCRRC